MHEYRHWTVHELSHIVKVDSGAWQEILTKKAEHALLPSSFVFPLASGLDQKQRPLDLCLEFREVANDIPSFISRTINRRWSLTFRAPSEEKKNGRRCGRPRGHQDRHVQERGHKAFSSFIFDFTCVVDRELCEWVLTFITSLWGS